MSSGPGGHRLLRIELAPEEHHVDLTRPAKRLGGPVTSALPVADRPIDDDDLARWTALGLALTGPTWSASSAAPCDLATEYATLRRQYGAAIGSFQAVQHLLADAFVLMEGSRSVALHAAWAVDALPAEEALAAAAVAKAYCARAATRRVRDRHPGPRGHRQHVGVPGSRLSAPRPPVLRSPGWYRGQHGPGAGALRDRGLSGFPRFTRRVGLPGAAARAGCRTTIPACPPSSTDDDYWKGSRRLAPVALRRRLLRHVVADRDRRAGVALGLRRRSSTRSWPPPVRRPGPAWAIWCTASSSHGNEDIRRASCPGSSVGASGGVRASASPTPVRSGLAPDRPYRDGDDFVISGPQGVDQLLRRCRLVSRPRPHRPRGGPSTAASQPLWCHAPARDRAAAAPYDQRDHQGIRRSGLRRRPGPGAPT